MSEAIIMVLITIIMLILFFKGISHIKNNEGSKALFTGFLICIFYILQVIILVFWCN